jgi:hypothetical protein
MLEKIEGHERKKKGILGHIVDDGRKKTLTKNDK